MGGKGGLKKQPLSAKKKLRSASGSPADAAADPKQQRSKRIAAAVANAVAESSGAASEAADPPPRPMEVDATTVATIKSEVSKRVGGTRPTPPGSCVLYLGHLPHGFYEEQMRGFFSQFGSVTRLRLARNKKTGRSKHYAFIEFKHAEVGEVVAKAMNGYLMFSKILVAEVMAPEKVHDEMFKNANRKWHMVDRTAIVRKQHNRARTEEEAAAREANLLRSDNKKRQKLAELGIDYEFGGYAESAERSLKRKRGVLTTEPPPKAVANAPPSKKRKAADAAEAAGAEEAAPAELETSQPGSNGKKVKKAKASAEEAPVAPPNDAAPAPAAAKSPAKKRAAKASIPAAAADEEPLDVGAPEEPAMRKGKKPKVASPEPAEEAPPATKKVKKAKASPEPAEAPRPATKKPKKAAQ